MNFEIPSVNHKQGIMNFVKSLHSKLFVREVKGAAYSSSSGSMPSAAPDQLTSQAEVFSCLLEMARQIAQHDARGLASLVTAILRPLQSDQILSVAERPQHAAREAIRFDQLFSSDYFFSYFEPSDCIRRSASEFPIDLARDIVLTTPWVRSGFASALANIGDNRTMGPWRQDSNHGITLLLPWRIAVVTGGNHSIASGILNSIGSVIPSDVLDLSPLFEKVVCDGVHFRCRASGKELAVARDGRMGALFEVGRLMAHASSLHPEAGINVLTLAN